MQVIPVDVGRLGLLLCVVEPAPKLVDAASGEVKVDRRTGETVYTVGVAVREASGRRTSVIEISLPKEPAGLQVGMPVQVLELVAVPWSMGNRHGVSFRATDVAPVSAARSGRGGGEQ